MLDDIPIQNTARDKAFSDATLTREEWLTYLNTAWKECLHKSWEKELTNMKDDDDTQCYRSELEAAVKAEREACAKVCDEASDKALALQSGRQDDLSSIILRHHAVAHQADAAAIRERGQA